MHHWKEGEDLKELPCELQKRGPVFYDISAGDGKDAQVILKPHPRDILDYEKLFSEYVVLPGKFPMEMMNFLPDFQVEKVISVFTVTDAIHYAKEKIYLVEDFIDKYEAQVIHRENEVR